MGVCLNAVPARQPRSNPDNGSPLTKSRPALAVLLPSLPKPPEAPRPRFPPCFQSVNERPAVRSDLTDRLVEQYRSAYVLTDARRRHEHLPVCAPAILRALDPKLSEALRARRRGFVDCQYSPAP